MAFVSPIGLPCPSNSRHVVLREQSCLRSFRNTRMSAAAGSDKKKIVIVGAGWAGLGAALHLSKLDLYDVTLLEAGKSVGGLVAGFEDEQGKPSEIGIHGTWRPYRNVFNVCDELGIRPFTDWTRSDSFSPLGKETSAPIFADLPRLPSPLGTLVYTQFHRVGLRDRLTALPLLLTLADFDPQCREDWERYDKMSARELLRTMGVSPELYRLIESMLLVGTFCPGEQTSAAACLAFLYFFILQEQSAFDVVWPRGTSGEFIFGPMTARIEEQGATILTEKRVTDYKLDDKGRVSGVVCGAETIEADAVVSCVGISGLQGIVRNSKTLSSFAEFRGVSKLSAIDVLAVRLYLDRRVKIDKPSNALFGFDDTTGGTLFDLNAIHDRYRDEPNSVVECDFYGSQQFTPMADEDIVSRVKEIIGDVYPDYKAAQVVDFTVMKVPRGVTHFSPGSFQWMLEPVSKSIPNFFNAGDWIKTFHGSFSQERALVTGLEAANNTIDFLEGKECRNLHADVLPVPENERHISEARKAAKRLRKVKDRLIPDLGWL